MPRPGYDPQPRRFFRRIGQVLRTPFSAARAAIDRSDLRSLEQHWLEIEQQTGTTEGYSEAERYQALLHAVPPLASCWVSIRAPKSATPQEIRALLATVVAEIHVYETQKQVLEGPHQQTGTEARDGATAEKAHHNVLARLALAHKKQKYLRRCLSRFGSCRSPYLGLDRNLYPNTGPAWTQG